MRLKSFEAHGFKSFADKVNVNFENGITAIVGPNGSGKSNISDAIRWVMGEQSIKYLRGTKMEDVIFAGSSARRPLGMADVTLVFDNRDHDLPVDFDEVSIRRRVYRSGESEYAINGKNCRLKDIVNLLADTGLGRGSLSIIGQNKIDEILNSRPEDRRTIFEETAGIAKYRLRKKEALRKLDDTAGNLLRIHDIQTEISSQLKPLEKAAEKVRTYKELDARYELVRVTQLVRRLDHLEKEKGDIEARLEGWGKEERRLDEEAAKLQSEIDAKNKELQAHEASFGAYQVGVRKKQEARSQCVSEASVYRERMRQGKIQIEQMQGVVARLEKDIEANQENLALLTGTYDEEEAKYQAVKASLSRTEKEKDELTRLVAASEKRREDAQNENFERMRELVTLRNDLNAAHQDEEQLHRRLAQMKEKMDLAEDEVKSAAERLANGSTALTDAKNQQERVKEKGTAAKARLDELAARLEEAKKAVAAKERQLSEKKARIQVIQNMERDHDGFSRGVKTILQSKAGWRSGICGVVGELLHVEGRYVTAIETALGGALQNIITRDAQTAKEAIRHLKSQKGGRATFLPLDTIRPRSLSPKEKEALKAPGIIGLASSLVSVDADLMPAVDFLLGQVLVAETLDQALDAAKRADMRVRVVTLEGDVIYSGGSLAGGEKENRRSFLSRHQELETHQKERAQLEKELAGLNQALQEVLHQEQDAVIDRNQCADTYQKLAVSMATLSAQVEQAQKELGEKNESLLLLSDEKTEAAKAYLAITEKIKSLEPQVKTLEEADSQKREEARSQEETLQKDKLRLETLNQKYQDVIVSYNTLKTQITSLESRMAEIDERSAKAEKDRLNEVAEIEKTEAMLKKSEGTIASLEEKIKAFDKSLEGTDEKTQAFIKTRKGYEEGRDILLENARKLQERLEGLKEKRHQVEMDSVRKTSEMESTAGILADNFKLSVEEAREKALTDIGEGALKKEEILLAQKIEDLGPVNLAAEEDYQAAKERYEFLTKQYDDMVTAKKQLELVISGINSDMTKRFREAFDKINEYFGKCYEKLFGGGKARLVIQNEENLLETGIDIEAQPPGKKMRNLSLFSGGERALTVIALLFALLSYHPAPFVILDEIDAPLDETNIDRFAEFLRDYGKRTQFIIITHRKGTMEAADTLHGVTMSESGVSRVLSVKLSEVAAS